MVKKAALSLTLFSEGFPVYSLPMEIIPFLIFAFIAFKIFSGVSKAGSSEQGKTAKEMMRRLNEQMQQASDTQNSKSYIDTYNEKGPTARGRERLALKNQKSPWGHEHDLDGNNTPLSPRAKAAANYLKKAKKTRVASHKNAEQYGRRGQNMDQNKNRTDSWGERGDGGFLNGPTLVILLVIGAGFLYGLSKLPPA